MIELKETLIIPIVINIVFSIFSGFYHRYLLRKSGMVIDRYHHQVVDREEVITELVIVIIATALALHFDSNFVFVIISVVILGGLAKYKMAQPITLTEGGILIKGKFEPWEKIKKIKIVDQDLTDIVLKRKSYEIINLQDVDEFISISKSYIKKRGAYDEK